MFNLKTLLETKLSTPSLGITEPDSGIFRLSAAFCRLRGFLPRHLFAQMNFETTIWIYRFAPL